ncbi:MAG: nucleotidyltransferase family protein [Verrucomicrobia bacterium]|nr:nucleotidyltransferase family protein [Verrucomicrobiota bacterium]
MSKKDILQLRRAEILEVARKHGAISVKVFGSVARGDETPGSDLDFLIELAPGRSLFDLGGIQHELEKLLQCHVDVVTPNGLHWFIQKNVLKEAVAI